MVKSLQVTEVWFKEQADSSPRLNEIITAKTMETTFPKHLWRLFDIQFDMIVMTVSSKRACCACKSVIFLSTILQVIPLINSNINHIKCYAIWKLCV